MNRSTGRTNGDVSPHALLLTPTKRAGADGDVSSRPWPGATVKLPALGLGIEGLRIDRVVHCSRPNGPPLAGLLEFLGFTSPIFEVAINGARFPLTPSEVRSLSMKLALSYSNLTTTLASAAGRDSRGRTETPGREAEGPHL